MESSRESTFCLWKDGSPNSRSLASPASQTSNELRTSYTPDNVQTPSIFGDFPMCNLCVFLRIPCIPQGTSDPLAACTSCRRHRVRCSSSPDSDGLQLYDLYSRIIEAVPTLQPEVAAVSEVVNRLHQVFRKAESILEDWWDSAEFDSITNRISFPKL